MYSMDEYISNSYRYLSNPPDNFVKRRNKLGNLIYNEYDKGPNDVQSPETQSTEAYEYYTTGRVHEIPDVDCVTYLCQYIHSKVFFPYQDYYM